MSKLIQLSETEFINLANVDRIYILDGRVAIMFNDAREPYFVDDECMKDNLLRFLSREAYHID